MKTAYEISNTEKNQNIGSRIIGVLFINPPLGFDVVANEFDEKRYTIYTDLKDWMRQNPRPDDLPKGLRE